MMKGIRKADFTDPKSFFPSKSEVAFVTKKTSIFLFATLLILSSLLIHELKTHNDHVKAYHDHHDHNDHCAIENTQ